MTLKWNEIDTFVFDCGDTMLSLDPSREVICRDVLRDMGLDVPLGSVKRAYTLVDFSFKLQSSRAHNDDKRDAFYLGFNGALAEALGIGEHVDAFDTAQKAAFNARRNWAPLPGVKDALAEMGARGSLFVLANWDKRLPILLERTGLAPMFRDICDSESLGAEKPRTEAYAAFLARTGVDASRAVYIGNEYKADVVGSRPHGFTPVLMDHAQLYGPHVDCAYFTSWPELTAELRTAAPGADA